MGLGAGNIYAIPFTPTANYVTLQSYAAPTQVATAQFDNFVFNGLQPFGPPVNTDPGTLNFQATAGGGAMNFTWNHIGWQLYTNAVGLGSANNWYPVPGSASVTNQSIPINPANPHVFFQMRYP